LRTLLVSWWAGYLLFAVAFTYHMPSHDYYHLPYVALVALGAATLMDRLMSWLGPRVAIAKVLPAAIVVALAGWGSARALPQLASGDLQQLRAYLEIGELTGHARRVLFLDREYGYPLMYHGQVAGDAWPTSDDLAAEALGGTTPLDAHARFARDFADYAPTHFIVTDLASLAAQPDLQQLLEERAALTGSGARYRVYAFKE
jgi:hypothetical protein